MIEPNKPMLDITRLGFAPEDAITHQPTEETANNDKVQECQFCHRRLAVPIMETQLCMSELFRRATCGETVGHGQLPSPVDAVEAFIAIQQLLYQFMPPMTAQHRKDFTESEYVVGVIGEWVEKFFGEVGLDRVVGYLVAMNGGELVLSGKTLSMVPTVHIAKYYINHPQTGKDAMVQMTQHVLIERHIGMQKMQEAAQEPEIVFDDDEAVIEDDDSNAN